MKKLLSVFLAVVTLFSCAVFSFAAEKGDVDMDGKVAAADARCALRFAVDLDKPTEEQFLAADYNGDQKITAADARIILRVAVGLSAEDVPPKVEYQPSEKELNFYKSLYDTAHPLLGQHKVVFDNPILKNFQKWCCLYTIGDVFRPALQKAGYTQAQIDLLAPMQFPKDSKDKLAQNLLGASALSFWFDVIWFIPSLLSDYYIKTPDAADCYFLYDFYDDMIELKVYEHSDEDRKNYEPRIGDVVFMSTKTNTYENGYPTVDHTAQIIEVYDDGTFLCTEGSLVESKEGDNLARVRERKYRYNEELGTYEFVGNSNVIILYAAQPHLS